MASENEKSASGTAHAASMKVKFQADADLNEDIVKAKGNLSFLLPFLFASKQNESDNVKRKWKANA